MSVALATVESVRAQVRARGRGWRGLTQWLAMLWITMLALLGCVSGAQAQIVMGSQTITASKDSNSAGQAEAFKVTASASSTVASISVYVDSGSAATKLVAGLYADNAGVPGALLTQGTLNAPVAAAWNTVPVPGVQVTAGAVYWIAILSPNGTGVLRFRDTSKGGRSETSLGKALTTLPTTWATGTVFTDSPLAAYVTGSGTVAPVLSVSPSTLSFAYTQGGTLPASQSISVSNTGTGTLSFTAGSSATWLSVAPTSGSAPATLQASVNVTNLAAGTYNGTITITSAGSGGSPATIPVTLVVSPAPTQPVLSVSPTTMSFNYTQGGTLPASQSISVNNTGTGTLSFTASSNASWLGVSPATGAAPATLQASANVTNLAAGTYNGTITITSTGATGSPASIAVTLVVNPAPQPVLSVTPTSLSFSFTIGGTVPTSKTLTVSNTGGGTLAFAASSNQTWLTVTPLNATAPQAETVGVDITNLTAGTYTGAITITATGVTGSPATIPVTLTVSNAATGGSADWPMVNRDPSRSGNASNDSTITTANASTLALQWNTAVDGKVVAQPLYLAAVSVAGATHDVVIAATAQNSLYALDANTGATLWRSNFGADVGGCQPPGGSGIRSAPVVDRTTGRIYLMSDDGKLHTIALADGTDAVPALTIIDLPSTNKVRGGLNLLNGNLYIATGSGGCDTAPWRGRIYRVDVSGAAPVLMATFDTIPSITGDNRGGGIWGYGGVSIDPVSGNVFAATGADSSGKYTPYGVRMLELSPTLALLGTYEPPHPATFPCTGAPCDVDFGATPLVFTPNGCPTMVAAGNKNGSLYVLPVDDLATSTTTRLQSIAVNLADDWLGNGGLGGVPAFWPGGQMVFVTDTGSGVTGVSAGVIAFSVVPTTCQLQLAWSVALPKLGTAESSPAIANGVVFVGEGGSGKVHGFDASTGNELWNSGTTIVGGTYAAPSLGGGKLFVGSWNGQTSADSGAIRAFAPGTVQPPPPPPPGCSGTQPSVLLGTQTIQAKSDSNVLGNAEAFQTTAAGCGNVGSITLYLDTTSNAAKVTVGLYSDNNGHPGTLLGQGATSAPVAGQWNTIPISTVAVTQNTKYWIGILGTVSGTIRFKDGSAGCFSESSLQTGLTALPSTWSTGVVYADCPLSAYGNAAP